MKLNARQIESAKPKDKPYKLSDGGGMYLEVFPNGTKSWRMKYRIAGKEKRVVFGVYPTVSLADARGKREEAKRTLAAGGDPSAVKQMERLSKVSETNDTFEVIALEWHAHKRDGWSKGYSDDILEALEKDIFPYIGKRSVADVKPPEMLAVLRKMEQRGVLDKLRKTRQACRQIFTYAVISGRAENNPVVDLAGVLKAPKKKHFPHLSTEQIPGFLRSLREYSGSVITMNATKLLMLTGARTIELRAAEWEEFDLESGTWQVPKERMKMKRPHIVPLSAQAIIILSDLKKITGGFKFVFPGRNDAGKPMSEASINQVIKRIGYAGKVTGHGFRHTMSTILHEQGFNSAWIELQLAHVDKNSIRGTYNHAQYLEGRREMLQWYADYIDSLEHS
ncbi:tyrosine-type recombinase/integrase [Serratia rubidaea]|uniref:Tyrosine-type recombinase/integrase n=1 Tax=Serratia rubidaea TaxID=61652 RepID=A0ABS0MHA6_SERRU|nr:integrase arm-type DNA-binding domain-containing protein [Serratia rubidaea]MBH1930904.1 tyrosine-type recombinase/integrase [Serratia rubidaea]